MNQTIKIERIPGDPPRVRLILTYEMSEEEADELFRWGIAMAGVRADRAVPFYPTTYKPA